MVELLLVGKFYRACPVEELRSSISAHVLKLEPINLAICSIANAAGVNIGLLLLSIGKYLAIEEGQIVRTGSASEARVWIRI